jgi:hypothetical protein
VPDDPPVNEWMARASRWQLGVAFGLLCGLLTGLLWATLGGAGWTGFLSGAIGTGIAGGPVGATLLRAQVRGRTEAIGVHPPAVRRAAGRAALGGAVPDDPDTRAAAYAMTQQGLEDQQRHRLLGLLGSLVFLGLIVRLALTSSPWWWVGVAVVLAGLAYGQLVLPRRLRRRAELLRP